jgi:hypothetical protein
LKEQLKNIKPTIKKYPSNIYNWSKEKLKETGDFWKETLPYKFIAQAESDFEDIYGKIKETKIGKALQEEIPISSNIPEVKISAITKPAKP